MAARSGDLMLLLNDGERLGWAVEKSSSNTDSCIEVNKPEGFVYSDVGSSSDVRKLFVFYNNYSGGSEGNNPDISFRHIQLYKWDAANQEWDTLSPLDFITDTGYYKCTFKSTIWDLDSGGMVSSYGSPWMLSLHCFKNDEITPTSTSQYAPNVAGYNIDITGVVSSICLESYRQETYNYTLTFAFFQTYKDGYNYWYVQGFTVSESLDTPDPILFDYDPYYKIIIPTDLGYTSSGNTLPIDMAANQGIIYPGGDNNTGKINIVYGNPQQLMIRGTDKYVISPYATQIYQQNLAIRTCDLIKAPIEDATPPSGSTDITNITVESNQIKYRSNTNAKLDNIVFRMADNTIRSHDYINGWGIVTYSNTITRIPNDQFKRNSNITELAFPSLCTVIGESACFKMSNLKAIKLPSTLTTIEEYAFGECTQLTALSLPNGVTTIKEKAFCACTILNLTIPNSVTILGKECFAHNYISSLTFLTGNNSITLTIGEGAFWNHDLTTLNLFYSSSRLFTVEKNAFGMLGSRSIIGSFTPASMTGPYYVGKLNTVKIGIGANILGNGVLHTTKFVNPAAENPDVNWLQWIYYIIFFFHALWEFADVRQPVLEILYAGTTQQWNSITKASRWYDDIPDSTNTVTCSNGSVQFR